MSSPVENTHEVQVDSNRLGAFVGRSGYFIKTKVVFPSKVEFLKNHGVDADEDGNYDKEEWTKLKVHCHVDHTDGDVKITLKCSDQELHDIALDHVVKYVEHFNKPKEEVSPKGKAKANGKAKGKGSDKHKSEFRKYFFKVLVSDNYIGRLIGVEGSNVTEFAEQLQSNLGLQRRPYIKIMSEGSERIETINVQDVDVGKIWIGVQFTGPKSFSDVKKAVKTFVFDTLAEESYEEGEEVEEDGEESDGGW